MTETVIQCKPRPRNRVMIKLSGGRFFTIHESEAFSFSTGQVLKEEDIKRLIRMDQYLRGKEKVLRLLSIRSRTKREIKTALEKMGLEEGVIRGVVNEMHEAGLIDDLRFAREYVRAKTELKNLGPHRINRELGRFGVSKSLINKALGETFAGDFQEELAHRAVRKKLGQSRLDRKSVKRISDYLKRKGFDFDVVNKITFELLGRISSEDLIER